MTYTVTEAQEHYQAEAERQAAQQKQQDGLMLDALRAFEAGYPEARLAGKEAASSLVHHIDTALVFEFIHHCTRSRDPETRMCAMALMAGAASNFAREWAVRQ